MPENQIIEMPVNTPARVQECDPMLQMIERIATNPDADIAKMRELLNMRREHEDRAREVEFNRDLALMQPEFPPIPSRGKGHNNATHALKSDMIELTKPAMLKYGFSLGFTNTQANGMITTRATLRHRSGHSIFTELTLKDDVSGSKNVVQAVGSSQSYGERYTMKAILNLAITDDKTDDNGVANDELATDAQRTAIATLYAKLNQDAKDKFDEMEGGIAEIKKRNFNTVIARLNKTLGVK